MSVVSQISVQNIRSHDKFCVKFSPNVTVITGSNGSGKTSLLEAIYLALQGHSFKGGDNEILKHDSSWWRIDVEFDDFISRTVTYNPSITSGRKKFIIDDKISYRLAPKNKLPVVLFEPDDLRLLNGSPNRRRQFIDRFISQIDPMYLNAMHKYERALKQRNNLLKHKSVIHEEMFAWNVTLSEYGAYIIDKRIAFIEKINSQLNQAYNEVANSNDIISVHYSNTYIGDIKQKLLNDFHGHIEKDLNLGFTSTGPHRHDVVFSFNNFPALAVVSRGEVRTIILALKFLEVGIIEQITNIKPIILLDDVFSELDINRQKSLSDTIRSHQIIITSTHVLSDNKNYKHVNLDN